MSLQAVLGYCNRINNLDIGYVAKAEEKPDKSGYGMSVIVGNNGSSKEVAYASSDDEAKYIVSQMERMSK